MIKIKDCQGLCDKISEEILSVIIEKDLSFVYNKEDIVVNYLCDNSGVYSQDMVLSGRCLEWYEYAKNFDEYIKKYIPPQLRPIYYRDSEYYFGVGVKYNDYNDYIDNLLSYIDKNTQFCLTYNSVLNHIKYQYKKNSKLYSEALKYFKSMLNCDKSSDEWSQLQKEFEQHIIHNETIPEEFNHNKQVDSGLDLNDKDNMASLTQNIPIERSNDEPVCEDELNKLYPVLEENVISKREIYDKCFKDFLEYFKTAIKFGDDDIVKPWSEDIDFFNLFDKLKGDSDNFIAYAEIYPIISKIYEYDSKYDCNELIELAKKLDLANDDMIFDEGFNLLKEDSIKYLLVTKYMHNTKNLSCLRLLFNLVFDVDEDIFTQDKDIKEVNKKLYSDYSDDYPFYDLIKMGVDVNSLIINNRPVVFDFMTSGNKYDKLTIPFLKEYNYNFDLTDSDGNNLIMYYFLFHKSSNNINYNLVNNLININFNIYHKNKYGETLLNIVSNYYSDNKELISAMEKLYNIKIGDIEIEFNNKLKEVKEYIKTYKKTLP